MKAAQFFYHANSRGTGSAIKLELCPANGDIPGCIRAQIAQQRTIAEVNGGIQTFPTFDWRNAVTVKFDALELAQVMQVLRGYSESIEDGKGLFHRSMTGYAVIKFSRRIEPRPGYDLAVRCKPQDGGEAREVYFMFTPAEALAVMMAIESAMCYVCFGIPEAQSVAVTENW